MNAGQPRPLATLRHERLMTVRQLAERAGLSVRAYHAVETGRTATPHPDTVRAICAALELEPAQVAEFAAIPDRWRQRRERNVARALDPAPEDDA